MAKINLAFYELCIDFSKPIAFAISYLRPFVSYSPAVSTIVEFPISAAFITFVSECCEWPISNPYIVYYGSKYIVS